MSPATPAPPPPVYFLEVDADRVLHVDEEGGRFDEERRLYLLLGGEPSEVFHSRAGAGGFAGSTPPRPSAT